MNRKTDLIIESGISESIHKTSDLNEKINVIKTLLDKDKSIKYNQKEGLYCTIYADFLKDSTLTDRVCEVVKKTLVDCIKYFQINKRSIRKILVIGLGNGEIKSDSLGPEVVGKLNVNNHIKDGNTYKLASFVPGVMGKTGMESFSLVKAVVDSFKPNIVFVIDSLFSKSLFRLNKTIQISTAGVKPGSGVGNNLHEISRETLGVEVISIGIPTVLDFYGLAFEILKEKKDHPILEILKIDDINMVVSSKDIRQEIEIMAYVISQALNDFFNLK